MSSALTKLITPLDHQKDDDDNIFPEKPFNMAMVASKGQGKSTILLNLLTKKGSPLYKRFNLIFLISPTCHKDDKFADFIEDLGPNQVYTELNPEVLDEIISMIETHKSSYRSKDKKKKPEYLICFDDCIHFLKGKSNQKIAELFTQNRHYNLSNFILVQKWSGYMPTIVRCNLDCLMIWKCQGKKEEETLLSEIGDIDYLQPIYDIATNEPYSFLYINQYIPSKTRFYKKFDLLFQA